MEKRDWIWDVIGRREHKDGGSVRFRKRSKERTVATGEAGTRDLEIGKRCRMDPEMGNQSAARCCGCRTRVGRDSACTYISVM